MLTRTKKRKKKYKKTTTAERFQKQKCAFVSEIGLPCKRNAVGKSTLCKRHGGKKFDPSLALSGQEVTEIVLSTRTKYKPEKHPILYIEYAREGLSPVEIAAKFEVGEATLDKWAEKYHNFQVAHDIGKVLHEAWWLTKGKEGLDSRNFNTVLYKFLTGNKLGYSDKSESRNFNTNQTVHGVLVVPKKMSEKEWEVNIETEGQEEVEKDKITKKSRKPKKSKTRKP